MSDKDTILKQLDIIGVDAAFIIQEMFLGYKYRKHNGQLYNDDADIPTKLIKLYYELKPTEISFDEMKTAFVKRYVLNESKLEGVNDETIHGKAEIAGFEKMYEYIHSDDIEYRFDVYTLKDLHKQLFSLAPHPECAGEFRNWDVYLPGTGTEISEWSLIRSKLEELDVEVRFLREWAPIVKESGNVNDLLEYLDYCVELKCKLIKVHPFGDGNGRTIRGFINKLLEDVNLPPIYIKATERTEYHKAMNLANNEGDYSDIKNFYRYKICDSIIELDINDTVRKYNKQHRADSSGTYESHGALTKKVAETVPQDKK